MDTTNVTTQTCEELDGLPPERLLTVAKIYRVLAAKRLAEMERLEDENYRLRTAK